MTVRGTVHVSAWQFSFRPSTSGTARTGRVDSQAQLRRYISARCLDIMDGMNCIWKSTTRCPIHHGPRLPYYNGDRMNRRLVPVPGYGWLAERMAMELHAQEQLVVNTLMKGRLSGEEEALTEGWKIISKPFHDVTRLRHP